MSTYKIVMQHKNSSGSYDTLLPKSYSGSFINISTVAGAALTVTGPNNYNQSYTLSSSEDSHGFAVMDDGNYSLKVTYNGTTSTKNISKTGDGIFTYIVYPYNSVLNSNSWEQISKASEQGVASSLWSIGDVKMDTINGTIGNLSVNGEYGFYIADFDHNKEVEGAGITFMGFKTGYTNGTDVALCDSNYNKYQLESGFIMNKRSTDTSGGKNGTNVGGWASSYMRNTIIPSFKQALSSSLKNVIKTTTIYTDNTGNKSNVASNVTTTTDSIYLPAEYEIFGKRSNANQYEQNHQTQFAYYKNGNSKIKYNHSSTSTAVYWWERSPYYDTTYYFCGVSDGGGAGSSIASGSYGFVPVFKV